MKTLRLIVASLLLYIPVLARADVLGGPVTNFVNGHVYYLLTSNNWTVAEAEAVSLGGHLATIRNAAEQNWVFSTFGSYGGISRALFIGLTDQAVEGSFCWISGETSTYRNWNTGEPNNYEPSYNEDYCIIYSPTSGLAGLWNDLPKSASYCSIAEVVPRNAAQSPVISSFSQNGELVCTNLLAGSVATVQWASSVTGPWTDNWAGLESVTADSNGIIRVSVPMFYRVRGVAPSAQMALIPVGSFQMGDTFNEGNTDERPTHEAYVSGFYMDRYEVTKALWDEVSQWATNHGYSFGEGAGKAENHPVQAVTWYSMAKWCNARSEKEGRTPAYYRDAAQTAVYRTGASDVQNDWVKWNAGYRLPTEAEWEKAARGGVTGHRFPWGDTISHSQANYYSTTDEPYDVSPTHGLHPAYADGDEPHTAPVGSFVANGYGVYDMTGNVWEMCWDWYDSAYYGSSPASDPRGPTTGTERLRRGAGWGVNSPAFACRVSFRASWPPNVYNNRVGFRCVLPLGQ